MRKILAILLSTIACLPLWSQQLSPSVISSAGDISKAAGITLDWTVGEVIIESQSSSDRMYTQGFHQPLLFAKVFHWDQAQIIKGFQIGVAPNPVQSVLNVNIKTPAEEKVYLTLIDFTGRRYQTQTVIGRTITARVNMSGMIPGIYILEARNANGELIQSFKIIKSE